MDVITYTNQYKTWKNRFPKEKSYIENIEKKIESQNILEDKIAKSYLLEKISYFHFNYFHTHVINENNYEIIFLNVTSKEELNHIINFYLNVSNKLNFFFPSFFPFLYCIEKNNLIFEKINNIKEAVTLKKILPSLNKEELHKIFRLIFYHFQLLSIFFSFSHYNLTPDDFLIIPFFNNTSSTLKNNTSMFKNFYINTIVSEENQNISELYKYYDFEELPYIVMLNIHSENIKNCFFKIDTKKYSFCNKGNIKINLLNKLIKVDRNNILTDIFSLLKTCIESQEEEALKDSDLINYFSYFIQQQTDNTSFKKSLCKLPNNLLDFGNHDLSFDLFLNHFENDQKIKEKNSNNNIICFQQITSYDKILDFIEIYSEELDNEKFYLENISNYVKNFSKSFFMKDIKEFSLFKKENFFNSENKEEGYKNFLKINFYIFCKLKNYFFEEEDKTNYFLIQEIFKENFQFIYDYLVCPSSL